MDGRLMIWTRVSISMLPSALQNELEGKRVFITGGTGVFGRWLIQELENTSCELVLLSRNPAAFLNSVPSDIAKRLVLVEGDICSFEYPEGLFDYIIHAATPVVSDSIDDVALSAVIVSGTSRVLDFASYCCCDRLLYISSGAVYGTQPSGLERLQETLPCNPISAYGKGKLIAENLCLSSGVKCIVARCFSFVGQGIPLDAHFAIGNFIGSCLRDEDIIINGDGSPLRSYMYSSDLVEWLIVMLVRGKAGEIYNVGSDLPISIADLAQKVRDLSLAKNQIEISLTADKSKAVARYIPCVKKASRAMSLKLKVDLDHSILKTLRMTCC